MKKLMIYNFAKQNLKHVLLLIILTAATSWSDLSSQSSWEAPDNANTILNPIETNKGSLKIGKIVYKQYCGICHGNKGKGDGLAGMSLKPRPADFTKESCQVQSDGVLYWKLTEGKAPMAGYKESLTEKQRWHLINYLRTLKK